MRLPPALGPGARVALVAPAGPLRRADELDLSIENARSLGWEPVPTKQALARDGYLAGDDALRARTLNEAFSDDTIDAIWCVAGGYGAMRLLPALDYDALRRRPKTLIGYSDITALHCAIGARCDLVTYHGPTARTRLTDFTRHSFVRAVIDAGDPFGTAADARVLRPGRASGPLVGGNLALLAALVGTPFAPDYTGAILFIEDVGETTYRIDRMLMQLQLSGALGKVAGIVFGQFTEGTDPTDVTSRRLDDVLTEAAAVAGVPAIAGAPIGHIDDQWTLPVGRVAELDADARTVRVV
jgi:muramoyltetrapeptide carboxypeptidase